MAAALAACGGGGGGTAGPAPTNQTGPAPGSEVSQLTSPESPDRAASGEGTAVSSSTPSPAGTSASPAGIGGSAEIKAGGAAPMLEDCEMFPSSAIFNTRIDDTSRFPVHANSNAWVNMVGAGTRFTANWGNSSNPANMGDYWGLPINVVAPGGTNWPTVSFNFAASGVTSEPSYPFKSDCATSGDGSSVVQDCTSVPEGARRFPFPSGQTLAEGGLCSGPHGCGDHHVLVVETGKCRLWESFYAHNLGGQWYAVTTAVWDLRSNALRPDDWASADAAGLPITPLLAKASEASSGEIRHALRVTFRDLNIAQEHVWPARHHAGGDNPGAIPFGALLRLRADFVIPDHWSTHAKAVALAAKRYGIYVSDNGEDFYVQGEPNSAWNPALWQELRGITMSNMEFVDMRNVTGDPRFNRNSMQASW